jgi:hypothetical protein
MSRRRLVNNVLRTGDAEHKPKSKRESEHNRNQKILEDPAIADLPSDPDICKMSDIGDRITNLRKKLKAKIEGNNGKGKLKDQFLESTTMVSITLRALAMNSIHTLRRSRRMCICSIAGSVHGRQPFQDLAEFAEDFVQKAARTRFSS